MTKWDDAWLAQYRTNQRSVKVVPAPNTIRFVIPRAIPLLNEILRMHWSSRRKYQQALSAEIAALIPASLGRKPIEHAEVSILRYSVGTPDPDAITPKALLDCLVVRSKRHPSGLGIIVDDSPDHLTLHVNAATCATQKEQRTEVTVAKACAS